MSVSVTGVAPRWALVAALVLAAYRDSLASVVDGLRLQTPLAFLAIAPLVAVLLGARVLRHTPTGPTPVDRETDWLVGLALMSVALWVLWVLPEEYGLRYWQWRLDLLTLPVFTAGVIAVLFGVRVLYRLRIALAVLGFVWPMPWRLGLAATLGSLTDATAALAGRAITRLELASTVEGAPDLLRVDYQDHFFDVTVSSPCSGVNGLVGFLVVGTAYLYVLDGPRRNKALWMATGVGVLFLLNVVRVVLIVAGGRYYGRTVAIDVLHPYLGIVTLAVSMAVMLAVTRRFGLTPTIHASPPRRGRPDTPVARLAAPVACLAAALAMGGNAQLGSFRLVADGVDGVTRMVPYAADHRDLDGWLVRDAGDVDAGSFEFGKDSRWQRFTLTRPGPSTGGILIDTIRARSRRPFETYTVLACYEFHGYDLLSSGRTRLPGGILAETATVHAPTGYFAVVAWTWPVALDNDTTGYERVSVAMSGRDDALATVRTVAATIIHDQVHKSRRE